MSGKLAKLSNSPNVDQESEHASAALVCTLLCENPVGERWQRLTAKAYQRRGFGSEFPRPLLMSAAVTRARTRFKGSVGGCHTPAGTPASTTPLTHVFTPRTASRLHPRESARELGLTATQSSPQAACACPRPNAEISGEGDTGDAFAAAATAETTRPNSWIARMRSCEGMRRLTSNYGGLVQIKNIIKG